MRIKPRVEMLMDLFNRLTVAVHEPRVKEGQAGWPAAGALSTICRHRAAWRRQGAARNPGCARLHARAPPRLGASLRRPRPRRFRHPRRALSRGCACGAGRDALRPPGQVDRGPARLPWRRSFARAAPLSPRGGVCRPSRRCTGGVLSISDVAQTTMRQTISRMPDPGGHGWSPSG